MPPNAIDSYTIDSPELPDEAACVNVKWTCRGESAHMRSGEQLQLVRVWACLGSVAGPCPHVLLLLLACHPCVERPLAARNSVCPSAGRAVCWGVSVPLRTYAEAGLACKGVHFLLLLET